MCCKQFITHIIVVAAEGLWHLGSLFYNSTQYSQRGCFRNLLWCDIPQHNAPQTGPHHIRCIYTLCRFCCRDKHTDSSTFRWPVFVMVTLESQNIFCAHTWSYNQSGVGAILALFSFLIQLPHQKQPEISVSIFSPTCR